MIYPYICPNCGIKEIVKSASESSRPEFCPDCGWYMQRQYTVPEISTKDIYTGYNPALGKQIKNKTHLRDELKRHESATGIHLEEVGNCSANAAPRETNWNLTPSECRRAGELLQSVSE